MRDSRVSRCAFHRWVTRGGAVVNAMSKRFDRGSVVKTRHALPNMSAKRGMAQLPVNA
jgi:hypothetical protein